MRKSIVLLVAAAPAAASAAVTCEGIRADVEAKIRAAGVTAFSVTIVDAAASAPGRIVGSCERGTRKLMYVQGATARRAPAKAPPMLTECRDGSVITSGNCPK